MRKSNEPIVYRGEIYYADLSPAFGSEQGGSRPVLIIQNNIGNKYAPTTIVAPTTSHLGKTSLPTHITLPAQTCGLSCASLVLLEQVKVVDKQRLKSKIGAIPPELMKAVDAALKISLGID